MRDGTNGGVRETLSTLFEAAYRTAHPSVCLPPHLPPVPEGGRIIVIGAGKGSAAMAVAAEEHYISTGEADKISGLISTRHGFGLPTKIIEIQLKKLETQLAEAGITVRISAAGKRQLAEEGYDPAYGARPLKRVIQQRLANRLAADLLNNAISENSTVEIGWDGTDFTFTRVSS